jgi:hypothetical protein
MWSQGLKGRPLYRYADYIKAYLIYSGSEWNDSPECDAVAASCEYGNPSIEARNFPDQLRD